MSHKDDDSQRPRGGTTANDPRPSEEVIDTRTGVRRVGRYELLAKIGEGATGIVYRAQDPMIRRIVALKLIQALPVEGRRDSPGSSLSGERLFRREAEAAGALQHSNVVTLYDAGRDGDTYYLAMELVAGETFAAELAREGRVSTARAIDVGVAVADALDYAHERGIVHRDIKPSNLMLLGDGSVKVADFGIARIAGRGSSTETAGGFVGTPDYMSPEQIRNVTLDGRSDIFSLGVVLYEGLTGRHPFRGSTIPATLHAILNDDPPPPHEVVPGVPHEISRVVLHALARDVGTRYARAGQMAAELRAIAAGAAVKAEPAALVVEHGHRPALTRRRFALAGGAALVAIAGGVVLINRRDRRDHGGGDGGAGPPRGSERAERAPVVPALSPAAGTAPVTLGVMLFKPHGTSPENAWMPEALRDALNTELSQLSRVKVYSKEFLDFLITRKNLTEIEAATQLGINKMLSGSFTATGPLLRIETHVVDVQSGLLEGSYLTVGRVDDFAKLRASVVLETVARLNLPVTEDEQRALVAQRDAEVDPVKRLLDAEGALGATVKPAPEPAPKEPRSSLLRWLARVDLDNATPAQAADSALTAAGEDEQHIRGLLEQYRKATESGATDALAMVYESFPPEQRAKQQHYFDSVRDLRVAIDNIDIAVVGDEAVVSYTRTDDFVDATTGRPLHASVRLTKMLRREGGLWRIVAGG